MFFAATAKLTGLKKDQLGTMMWEAIHFFHLLNFLKDDSGFTLTWALFLAMIPVGQSVHHCGADCNIGSLYLMNCYKIC